jgi:hypothetical protein
MEKWERTILVLNYNLISKPCLRAQQKHRQTTSHNWFGYCLLFPVIAIDQQCNDGRSVKGTDTN